MVVGTRAAFHIPVMLEEVLELLQCGPGGTYLDGTVGDGGHAEAILERIGPTGFLLGLDCDTDAIARAAARLGKRDNLVLAKANFADMKSVAASHQIQKVNGILLDLGLSSFQLASAERGFSFQTDGPLDMRMDRRQSLTAEKIVNSWPETKLANLFWEFGEERRSRAVARAIVQRRKDKPFNTTADLAQVIRENARMARRGAISRERIDPSTRCFQAIRIAVNDEMGNLARALGAGIELLCSGGRFCVIAFHSLEDRQVKRAFAQWSRGSPGSPYERGYPTEEHSLGRVITKKALRPASAEVARNPRSRSARLRAFEKA